MKKIININLSGRVIPIEDTAYESLKRYIESLRRYFAKEEGRDEIINDIESRIAELMNEKIRRNNNPVSDADIDEIIGSMGRIEDFEKADAMDSTTEPSDPGFTTTADGSYQQQKRQKGRLHRNGTDKMIGGVCSGIASYINMDPAIVRLLFAIITLGGFGFGFLVYILLWIILPEKHLDTYIGKRLFRNPDDRIIGGVAGGIAAYFNRSTQTIRVIFAAPLILNILINLINGIFSPWRFDYSPVDLAFGSITSTFILAYIVLWIVLPEAKSPFEKMEMRGEKVDVNRIRQNVQEGMSDFKTKAEAWGEDVKAFGKRASTRGKEFAKEAEPVATGIGHIIGVLFKAFFLIVAGSIAFALFVLLMVVIFGGGTVLWPVKEALFQFVLEGFWQKAFFWGTLILFIAVPLIGFIVWLVRRIMRVRSRQRYLGWTFGGLWFLGWVALVGLITSVATDFRVHREAAQDINVMQPANGKMVVMVNDPEIRYMGDLMFVDSDNTGWNFTDDSLQLGNIKIEVSPSRDSNYYVTMVRKSFGNSYNKAMSLANRINYKVQSMDSILDLGSGFSVARNDKFRGQEVEVQIQVPVGKKIRFDETIVEKFSTFDVRVNERRRNNVSFRWDDHYYLGYRTNVDYTMTASDGLVAADEGTNNLDSGNTQNTDTTTTPATEEERRIEEQKRRIREKAEEEIRRLEERERRTGFVPGKRSQAMNHRNDPFLFSFFI
jgi:phage shock protein PspC (stress-responsive transcriptional regulator)/heme/copper-type cytochrome/quinol oxidase subunit 2